MSDGPGYVAAAKRISDAAKRQDRNLVIEECARVAETIRAHTGDYAIAQAAAAIRALKDK